jgi:DNA-binding MarR family transcriptional regulator
MDQERATPPAKSPTRVAQQWADLADLILVIAREIQFRGYSDESALSLSQSEGMVMRFLASEACATPSRIAAATGLQRTNVSPVLRDLEKKGLIERRVIAEDRRGVTVHRTERGASNYALVRREWGAAVSAAAQGDTTDLDAAVSLLKTVETGLTRMRPRTAGSPDRDARERGDSEPRKTS